MLTDIQKTLVTMLVKAGKTAIAAKYCHFNGVPFDVARDFILNV